VIRYSTRSDSPGDSEVLLIETTEILGAIGVADGDGEGDGVTTVGVKVAEYP
jgi:hypothetical protein